MTWYRSLYWRTGMGFVVFLVLILTVQVVFLAWLVDRSVGTLPGRSPWNFADLVATDVGAKIARSHQADLESYLVAHAAAGALFQDRDAWAAKAILNVARVGKFSSDRAVSEYAETIWSVRPVH